jgi:hypothetical protein
MSGRTRRATCVPPPPAMNPPPGRCRIHCHRLSTLTASRCAASAPMGASGGPIQGAMSHTSASAPLSALRTLTMVAGILTVAPSHSAGSSNGLGASKMLRVDSNNAGDCDPCLRTCVFPISPAGQFRTNTRPTYGSWPGATRHPDSASGFAATLRYMLSLHQSGDGLVTGQFLDSPLA